MRIIQLASGDLWAGAEVQLFHLVMGLSKTNNLRLLIVLLNGGQLERELKNKGIDVVIIDESSLSGISIISCFNKIVRNFKPDVIHTHRTKENVFGGLVAKFNGCKSVRTVHGASEFSTESFNLRRSFFSLLDKISALLLQDKIIAVSDELKKNLIHNYPKSKVEVISNSIDLDFVISKANEAIDYHFPESELNIVFAGRFVSVKRIDIFYEIAKQTLRTNVNVHFYMIGDGPLKQDMEQKIKEDNLQNNIHLLGFISNPLPYFKKMDLLIFTSDHEGLPMTLLEAMALKLPVLSTRLETIEYVLCNASCGFIRNAGDISSFVKVITGIVTNKTEAANYAVKAYHRLLENYTSDRLLNSYLNVYDELIAHSK